LRGLKQRGLKKEDSHSDKPEARLKNKEIIDEFIVGVFDMVSVESIVIDGFL
jgi:hypothetical protein